MDTPEMEMSYVEALKEADIEFGKRLWQSLQRSKKFPFKGILWLFQPQAAEWHLVIATPKVDQVGQREAYRELADLTRKVEADSAQLLSIELISPTQPLYQALRSVFGKTASVEGARLGNTQVQGMFINDAYLYAIK
jgi:hypothetical protein